MAVVTNNGRGIVKANHCAFEDYFHEQVHRSTILYPIKLTNLACLVDIDLFVRGGGINAQVEACRMALARCLVKRQPTIKHLFKKCEFLLGFLESLFEFYWIF